MKIFFLVLLVILCEAHQAIAQSTGVTPLQKGFMNPPLTARPKALWPWVNENVSFSQITYEMEEAKRKGMGGFDIWDIGTNIDPDSVLPAGPAAITLDGPWELRFQQNGNAPARDTFEKLIPLNESLKDGIKYFSGTVAYHHSFSMSNTETRKNMRVFLSLGKVKEIAEVYLNGKNLGLLWHTPFQIDVTDVIKPGQNHLVIEIVNTPNNALIGNAKLSGINRKLQSNIARLPNAWSKPFAEAPLLDAGLIGPVTISYAVPLNR